VSGIVGILHLDGEPVDRALLGRMTEFMTFRGPDAQQIWVEGAIGFGHTMLRTTWEAEYEHQPFTLDGQVQVVADARIDDREVLAQKLEIAPLPSPPFEGNADRVVTDVELILRAYLRWGEDCVQHLLGDFAFAIWDGRKQRLFCARDQFGVKLFYYSRVGNCLIFSNTLNCIRQHPRVSSELNEAAIGDFLLFDMNYNPETTTFVDIQRLPPAHNLIWSDRGLKICKYWTLTLPEAIRYKNDRDYIDRFKELMGQAVSDRLRTEKVSIFFSGGLDSTTIAATALDVVKQKSQPLDLKAFTVVYDRIIPDQERYFSGIAATALNLPIHYLTADDYQIYEGWDRSTFSTPEPYHDPLVKISLDQYQQASAHSRVALYGQGGDETLRSATIVELLKVASWREIFLDVMRCIWIYRLRPPVGIGLAGLLQHWRQRRKPNGSVYPSWLNSSFAERLNLPDRWRQIKETEPKAISHQRSKSAHKLTAPLWWSVFEDCDASFHRTPLEVRLPFLDLRLLNYLLALPPLPWCVRKELFRLAMHDVLPAEIYQRPKAPLAGNPIAIWIAQCQKMCQDLESGMGIESYIALSVLNQMNHGKVTSGEIWQNLRSITLRYWLGKINFKSIYFQE
jgi:asparagine synthase (glutamine-hydrolysing)